MDEKEQSRLEDRKQRFVRIIERLMRSGGFQDETQLAKALGMSPGQFRQRKYLGSVPYKEIVEYARAFALSLDDILELTPPPDHDPAWGPAWEDEREFYPVPLTDARLCAGGGSWQTSKSVKGYLSFRRDWLSKKGPLSSMVVFEVFGDSMSPTVNGGDIVLVDESQKDPRPGVIAAVGIGDMIAIKRLDLIPGKIRLRSDNPNETTIDLDPSEFIMIGRVIWLGREIR